MPRNPVLSQSHSAATTAPSANPSRLNASCVMDISSTGDLYLIMCVPGTSPMRSCSMSISSALCSSFSVQAFFAVEVFDYAIG